MNAGPDAHRGDDARDRRDRCCDYLAASGAATLDITGGAPELNPHFRELVRAARDARRARDRPLQPHDPLRAGPGGPRASSSRRTRGRSSPRCRATPRSWSTASAARACTRRASRAHPHAERAGLRHARAAGSRSTSSTTRRARALPPRAGDARGRLQAHPRREVRHRVQPALHAREHADPALRLDAGLEGPVQRSTWTLLRDVASRREPRRA